MKRFILLISVIYCLLPLRGGAQAPAYERPGNLYTRINSLLLISRVYEQQGNYNAALAYDRQA